MSIIKGLLLLMFTQNLFAQNIVKGTVKSELGVLLSGVNITYLYQETNQILSYTFSDQSGAYILGIKDSGRIVLEYSSLGFQSKKHLIYFNSASQTITVDVTLEAQEILLNEVILESNIPIKRKQDTIVFNAKHFSTGDEQSVEDLLRKIPGLHVDAEGSIKVGNQEIEKLMVEGDDFFEKGYRILSKNMPAYPIRAVELLENYSNNRLLKGIEESDKIALNLKLDEKSKNVWFGNVEANLGNSGFYSTKGNLMNFGKKSKYYFLTNLNSVGYDGIGDINHLIRSTSPSDIASVGDNQKVINLINLSSFNPHFKESRTNFNNTELVSLNTILNPTEKLKIKLIGFFNWDETDFYRNSIDEVVSSGSNFTNTEDYKLQNKLAVNFGKLNITYNISNTKSIEATTKYNSGVFKDISNLVFNNTSTRENLQYQNTLLDHKISFANKVSDQKVIIISARFIDEKTPQNYGINQFFYGDLFPSDSTANNVIQESDISMQFAGVRAHLLDRKKNGHLLELQLGNEYKKNKLNTAFTLLEGEMVLNLPDSYQNQASYHINDLYFNSKYRYEINEFALVGKLSVHQLFNRLGNNGESSNEKPFFINPSIGFDWEINKKNKVSATYTYSSTNTEVVDLYSNYVLTGFRSFVKGADSFSPLDASNTIINYQLGSWSDRFFASTFLLYSKNFDFHSMNTMLSQNYTQAEKIVVKDRDLLNITSKLDYYFASISSNLKLNLGFTKNEFKNMVNNTPLRLVTYRNYNYGLELRSGFKGVFNYHIGAKWIFNEIEASIDSSYINTVNFLDLSFVFNDLFSIQLQSERYYFGSLPTDNDYYFIDFSTRYKVLKNKLTLGLSGKNILDTKNFRSFSISDIGTTTTEYRLLPRYVLLQMDYRF